MLISPLSGVIYQMFVKKNSQAFFTWVLSVLFFLWCSNLGGMRQQLSYDLQMPDSREESSWINIQCKAVKIDHMHQTKIVWMTKKCKHIFTHWRVKLLKILLQDTVHGRTLHGFKQKQVPGRFCEDEKTKSRCQFWQAVRTHCQVAARLGCAMVGQQGKLGQPPPSAAWSHCAWNQWAEPGWGWRPTLLCRPAGMGWPQGQARAQVGEVGAAEFKADVSVPGAWSQAKPGSSLDTAPGLGLRPPMRLPHILPHHAAAFPAAILELASGWLGNGGWAAEPVGARRTVVPLVRALQVETGAAGDLTSTPGTLQCLRSVYKL